MENTSTHRVEEIIEAVKPLAVEYYQLTGKPLGVTGEIAECLAAQALGLELVPARTLGYDAIRYGPDGPMRIQIKGRAFGEGASRSQRLGQIKLDAPCDTVMLVLLDNASLELREIWEAPFGAVAERLTVPGSKSRDRGALGVSEFTRIAQRVWSKEAELPRSEAAVVGKVCPECGYRFKGSSWGGIDGHWRSSHEHIMPYEEARSLILSDRYSRNHDR